MSQIQAMMYAKRVLTLLTAGNFDSAHRVLDEAELSMQHVPAGPLFTMPLAQTSLEDRVINSLERAGITTIGDLVGYTDEDLEDKVPGCGKKSVAIIKEVLAKEISRRRGK